jgi:hypothetical protein
LHSPHQVIEDMVRFRNNCSEAPQPHSSKVVTVQYTTSTVSVNSINARETAPLILVELGYLVVGDCANILAQAMANKQGMGAAGTL